jgi:hypothetical protein
LESDQIKINPLLHGILIQHFSARAESLRCSEVLITVAQEDEKYYKALQFFRVPDKQINLGF